MGRIRALGVKRLILLAACLLLSLGALACAMGLGRLANTLETQKAAVRWKGDGELDFAQISCFLPADAQIDLEQVYSFRYALLDKLKAAALDAEHEDLTRLFADAWSSEGKAMASTALGRGEVRVTAVGGRFFDFHPILLLDGNYISESDLMQDRVLLDEDLAWLLFGGTQLQGLELRIDGQPFVVAGVIRREQDFASRKAYSGGMGLFMSYDAYRALREDAGISCYELTMPEPVKNFAISFVREKFPIGEGEILQNTGRFGAGRLLGLLRQFGSRSMQHAGVLYPYWENAARCLEDWCALLLLGAILMAALPVFCLLTLLLGLIRRGRRRLSEDWAPELMDKTREAIRVRQRRRWEKKHPGKE